MQVWNIRLGKCFIVTSRLYAILGTVFAICGSCFYVYMRPSYSLYDNPLFHHNMDSHPIDSSWTEYLADCGGEKVLDNYIHTKLLFNDKYENNEVSWRGFYAAIKQKQAAPFGFGTDHALSLLIKMEPTESVTYADLVLSVSTSQYREKREMFDSL